MASLTTCRLHGAAIQRASPLGPGRALTLPCGWNNAGRAADRALATAAQQGLSRELSRGLQSVRSEAAAHAQEMGARVSQVEEGVEREACPILSRLGLCGAHS